ncbi:hypothetical protein KDL01_08635 [Actinospica durhamensis]|uniref:Uncharacterized protein n=1 Tax=Actinospica durhamensis TaxID=1508375 RepID=A0A941EIV6_9ACTN|nr:hypothetical protein [Actinospica durhamensis]
MAGLRVWGALPERYSGRQVATSTIDAQGRIVALLVDPDATCAQRVPLTAPYDATAVVIDGGDRYEVEIHGLDLRFPKIDTLGDGFVLAAARCTMPSGPAARTFEELEAEIPHNARVIGADGGTTCTFHAGDGIEDLMTDAAGDIWIGYFDEASICALLPGRRARLADGSRPQHRATMSTPGLIRWTSAGEPAWYALSDRSGPRSWVDCYVLNVGREYTWAYPYTGFPLVEIDKKGVRCVRRTPVDFATGIMVDGGTLAFVASAGGRTKTPGHYTVTLAHTDGGPIEATGESPLLLPDGSRPRVWAKRTVCRDGRMWMQFEDPSTWYVIEV